MLVKKIALAQDILKEHDIDGWLIYDFHQINPLGREFLELSDEILTTRRFFYFIPKQGAPVKIVHRIESGVLNHLPGEKKVYLEWKELNKVLKELLGDFKAVAMEYSPMNKIPTISKVDAGIVDLVKDCGVEVISSGSFLQYFTNCMTPGQIQSHIEAGIFLNQSMAMAFEFMREALLQGKNITEFDVSEFVLKHFHSHGYIAEHAPICAFNENSADPHYMPHKKTSKTLKRGDIVMLDIFAKQKIAGSIYADMTNMAFAGDTPPAKFLEIFDLVKKAQNDALTFLKTRFQRHEIVKGFEVDEIARDTITAKGFGGYFTHRTGHNIFKNLHGPGTNLDSLETLDDRPFLPATCFSIEPGIYLPEEFGVRLEISVLIDADKSVKVTCGQQTEINCLLYRRS